MDRAPSSVPEMNASDFESFLLGNAEPDAHARVTRFLDEVQSQLAQKMADDGTHRSLIELLTQHFDVRNQIK